jgi:protein involved in polysaccharide export with SLBB domain
MSGFSLLAAGVLVAWGLTACAGHQVEEPTSFEIYLREPPQEPARYVIQAGDRLEVRFLHAPEQNVQLVVRPDGYISLPLANEVLAAGRTAEDVRLEITRAWEREYRQPEVAVIVQSATAYKIHVGGQVKSPGVFELLGERTVLQAIFEAGSFLPTATLANVIVIRPEAAGRFAVIPLDLTAVLDGSDTRQNIALRPYDAVYVPSSAIADINQWVDQYIRRNIPFSLGSTISLN